MHAVRGSEAGKIERNHTCMGSEHLGQRNALFMRLVVRSGRRGGGEQKGAQLLNFKATNVRILRKRLFWIEWTCSDGASSKAASGRRKVHMVTTRTDFPSPQKFGGPFLKDEVGSLSGLGLPGQILDAPKYETAAETHLKLRFKT